MSKDRYYPAPQEINGREGRIIHQRWRILIHQFSEEDARALAEKIRTELGMTVGLECFLCCADKDDRNLGEVVFHREILQPLELMVPDDAAPELSVVGGE